MNLGQDDRDPTGRFIRGLTLGALLGAIIAGSSIWTKARARRSAVEATPPSDPAVRSESEPIATDVVADDGPAGDPGR